MAGEEGKGLRRVADSSPGHRISQKPVTGADQHRYIHKQDPVFQKNVAWQDFHPSVACQLQPSVGQNDGKNKFQKNSKLKF